MFACSNKGLNKKILAFHKVKVPWFYTFYRRRKVWLPKKMKLPAVIKPLWRGGLARHLPGLDRRQRGGVP